MGNKPSIIPEKLSLPLYDNVERKKSEVNFSCERIQFLGGHDDDIMPVPSFVPLALPTYLKPAKPMDLLPIYYKMRLAKIYKRTHGLSLYDALVKLNGIAKQLGNGSVRLKDFTKLDYIDPILFARHSKAAKKRRVEIPENFIKITKDLFFPVNILIEKFLHLPTIGIYYDDLLRARHVGPVVGRLLYTLGLAPGEETMLEQKSWTKKETFFEDVVDREIETTQEFSSTWSTSFMTQIKEAWAAKGRLETSLKGSLSGKDLVGALVAAGIIGGSAVGTGATAGTGPGALVGGGVGAAVGGGAGLGTAALLSLLNVDGQIAGSIEGSYDLAKEIQSKVNREISRKASLKARQQHKTTFKVTSDVGEEFTSKRVIRNQNPDRSMELYFFKIMEKLRCSLERHDAFLCIRLCVYDPLKMLREQFLEEVNKLDPVIPQDQGPQPPAGIIRKLAFRDVMQKSDGTIESGLEENKKHFEYEIQEGYSLVKIEIEFKRAINEKGDVVYENDFKGFQDVGGVVEVINVSPVGAEGVIGFDVRVVYPEPSWSENKTGTLMDVVLDWGGEIVASLNSDLADVNRVVYDIYVVIGPKSETINGYIKDREEYEDKERQEIQKTFSLERLIEMLSPKRILDQLRASIVTTFLLDEFIRAGGEEPNWAVLNLEKMFLWDKVHMEVLPWWISPKGQENHREMEKHIHSLPAEVIQTISLYEYLASPYVVAYLPITPGREKDVLRYLYPNMELKHIHKLVQDFNDKKNKWFKPIRNEELLSTYDAIESPKMTTGTPLNNDNWDNGWEIPARKFIVLDEWSEIIPTDGVHVEAVLGSCSSMSPIRESDLLAEIRERESKAVLNEAEAISKLSEIEDNNQDE